jgi:HEAT repeat protein
MVTSDPSAIRHALGDLFEAERTRRRIIEQIASGPPELVFEALGAAVVAARSHPKEDERVLELEAIADILGQLAGPAPIDALIDILGSDEPQARHAAGVALEEIAFERFKEVALGIERALATLPPDHLALPELPYLLLEIPEPGVPRLLHRFLDHPNEEVVSSGIEACVELGDASSVPRLARLEKDLRLVRLEVEDEQDTSEEATVTIGELAKEAREMIEALDSEEHG